MLEQAQRFGAEFRLAEVQKLDLAGPIKKVETSEGLTFLGRRDLGGGGFPIVPCVMVPFSAARKWPS